MSREKKSFFERLTGSMSSDDMYEEVPQQIHNVVNTPDESHQEHTATEGDDWMEDEDPGEGQLTVDVYQTPTDIIVKTMVAGVHPRDLDVTITRDMVTIRGKREEASTVKADEYFHRELYWGSFSRTILLPQEVEVEEAEAVEKHGLLILKLPKVDKDRQTKLKIKSE